MGLLKNQLQNSFLLPACEKHFHDYDETWVIVEGTGTGYWIDHVGQRVEFQLEKGDIWMIPAGYEHGSEGTNSEDFAITVFFGTMPLGSHAPGHYYVEKECYIPTFVLQKNPSSRYGAQQ